MTNSNLERIKEDIVALAQFSATAGNGVTRLSYTKEHAQARDYIVDKMKQAGLDVRQDPVGNLIGRRKGSNDELPAIAVGSHFDSVRNGGRFDGVAGIVAGLEVARLLKTNNLQLQHPYEVIAIVEEEGSRFNSGIFGGKVISGLAKQEDLDILKDSDGITIRQAMLDFGLEPEKLAEAARSRSDLGAFFELHIEQGPVLEAEDLQIGLVDTIVGIHAFELTIAGRPDHAGTTPMMLRSDALVAASKIVLALNNAASQLIDRSVATVGKIQIQPGSVNVVPGKAVFTVEIRSANSESIDWIKEQVQNEINSLKAEGFSVSSTPLMDLKPTRLSTKLMRCLEESAEKMNIDFLKLPSGAGHDSMCIAQITDTAMLFVPSKDGRSHCPEEFTEYSAIQTGCDILYQAVLSLDKQ